MSRSAPGQDGRAVVVAMVLRPIAAVWVTLICSQPLRAQTAVTPNTPMPAYEALTSFEGSWSIEERPASQGFVETCAWLPDGRRHMVCRSTWRVATGAREGWSIFSFRVSDSTYLYHGFRAGGTVEPMLGRRLSDGWEFTSDAGTGASRQRARVVITRLTSDRFRLVASTATGDAPFVVVDTEHYVRVARPR